MKFVIQQILWTSLTKCYVKSVRLSRSTSGLGMDNILIFPRILRDANRKLTSHAGTCPNDTCHYYCHQCLSLLFGYRDFTFGHCTAVGNNSN